MYPSDAPTLKPQEPAAAISRGFDRALTENLRLREAVGDLKRLSATLAFMLMAAIGASTVGFISLQTDIARLRLSREGACASFSWATNFGTPVTIGTDYLENETAPEGAPFQPHRGW